MFLIIYVRFIQDNYSVARCADFFRVKYISVLYSTKYITQIVSIKAVRRNMKFFNTIKNIEIEICVIYYNILLQVFSIG